MQLTDTQILWIALISNLALLIFVAAELRKLQGRVRRWRTELRMPFTWFSWIEAANETNGGEPYKDEQHALSMSGPGCSMHVTVEHMRKGQRALMEMNRV